MTLRLLWREYRDQHPEGLGYSRFCSYYQSYAKTLSPVMRQVHKAGEKIFVDYLDYLMVYDEKIQGEKGFYNQWHYSLHPSEIVLLFQIIRSHFLIYCFYSLLLQLPRPYLATFRPFEVAPYSVNYRVLDY